jgi:hypothetical protein
MGLAELAAAVWGAMGLLAAWRGGVPWLMPILSLYVFGFAYHGVQLFVNRLREAVGHGSATPRPDASPVDPASDSDRLMRWRIINAGTLGSWALIPLGVLVLGILTVLVSRAESWRQEPLLFAGGMLGMGAIYLLGLAVVRSQTVSLGMLAWILAVGAGLQLIGMGLWHSDDVLRYVVEGHQILAGQNPYAIAPHHPAAQALVPTDISAGVNHPWMTAIYPPVCLLVEAGVQALLPGVIGFTVAAAFGSLACIVLALALMMRQGLAPGLILAVAWNPVLPFFAGGEAHNDILLAGLVLLSMLLAMERRPAATWFTIGLAILAKPFAIVLLPAWWFVLGWKRSWVLPLTIVVCYLPFLDAGRGLVTSLLTFGGAMHFHGALDPWIRLLLATLVTGPLVEPLVRVALLMTLALGVGWLWLRRGGAPLPTLCVRLLAVLMLCLPTLHPWYFMAIVVLLPFARSWALAVWTGMAGVYWLHGLEMAQVGHWTETPWVTALAHLPAVGLMAYEVFGPWREQQEPGRLWWLKDCRHA